MRTAFRQFYRKLFGLQFRTTVLLTGVVLAATGLTGTMYLRIASRLTFAEAKRHTQTLAKALAVASGGAVEREDRRALLRIAEDLASNGDVSYVIFTNMGGELLASYQRGAGNITHLILDDTRLISVEPINQPQHASRGGGGPEIDIVYPIVSATSPTDSALSPTVGYVRLGVSLAATEDRLAETVRNIFGLAVGITLLMVPLGHEVVRRLISPINRLSDAAHAFAAGQLDSRVSVDRRDEIGNLAQTFNAMADELADSHNQLVKLNAELEDRVLQRTTALEDANDRLREMAVRDTLTGLYNRRHFSELLERLFSEATRYDSDITCMMVDLDNLKQVNDSYGHQTGDDMLKLTARVIQDSIRESDVAVRFGGDEFVILLPRTSPVDARASAERLLTNFRARLIQEMPETNVTSLSIGLASREHDQPEEAVELVNLADEALYLAKAGGKNRITVLRPVAVA